VETFPKQLRYPLLVKAFLAVAFHSTLYCFGVRALHSIGVIPPDILIQNSTGFAEMTRNAVPCISANNQREKK
jgi:hypothetical protein